jgi:DNA-binding CsgD family transcriptional regulator
MGFIYIIRDRGSERFYVGKTTKTLKERWERHILAVRKGSTTPLHTSMRSRPEDFDFGCMSVLEECSTNEINTREKFWIAQLHSLIGEKGYNVLRGGDGGSRPFIPLSISILQPLVEGDLSKSEIANSLGVKPGMVDKSIRHHWGCSLETFRKSKRLPLKKGAYVSIPEDVLLSLISQGKTLQEISEFLGVTSLTVRRKIKRLFHKSIKAIRGEMGLPSVFPSRDQRGENNGMWGKKHSLEAIERMSKPKRKQDEETVRSENR